jgi:LemA protein
MKSVFTIVLVALVAVVFLGGGCVLQGYNKAVKLDEAVKVQWAQVDNQLQRRYELLPNLVETVKGVAAQEEKIYLGVARAREAYFKAQSVDEKVEAAGGVERALSRLLVLRETYPELRSNEAFLKLQDQLEGTENRIAVARKDYNDSVGTLNTYVKQLPGSIYASFAGVQQAEYFEVGPDARTVPKVDFAPAPATAPAATPAS